MAVYASPWDGDIRIHANLKGKITFATGGN
jgi:hypothetical protein